MIEAAAARHGLRVEADFAASPEDAAAFGARRIVLLGVDGEAGWRKVEQSVEYGDGAPDPLDRWSVRAVGALADALGGRAVFPFGGPPYAPFLRWATQGGGAWNSPIGLLVHEARGLWISFRGAVLLGSDAPAAQAGRRPCDTCAGPCRTACPVSAFGEGGFDEGACAAFVASAAGRACREGGCRARAACPIGAGDPPAQGLRRHAMAAFVRARIGGLEGA